MGVDGRPGPLTQTKCAQLQSITLLYLHCVTLSVQILSHVARKPSPAHWPHSFHVKASQTLSRFSWTTFPYKHLNLELHTALILAYITLGEGYIF